MGDDERSDTEHSSLGSCMVSHQAAHRCRTIWGVSQQRMRKGLPIAYRKKNLSFMEEGEGQRNCGFLTS